MKQKAVKSVRHKVDLSALPPLTEKQQADLQALANLPDEKIDYSDAPTSSDTPKQSVRGRFYKPVKEQITARVDADVLAWLKAQGAGYQGRMNAILRREMLASIQPKRRA